MAATIGVFVYTGTLTAASFVLARVASTLTADSYVKATGFNSFTFDAEIAPQTFITDSVVKVTSSGSILADAYA